MGPTIYCGALTGGYVGAVSKDEATRWSSVAFGAWPLPRLWSERVPRAIPAPDSLIATAWTAPEVTVPPRVPGRTAARGLPGGASLNNFPNGGLGQAHFLSENRVFS